MLWRKLDKGTDRSGAGVRVGSVVLIFLFLFVFSRRQTGRPLSQVTFAQSSRRKEGCEMWGKNFAAGSSCEHKGPEAETCLWNGTNARPERVAGLEQARREWREMRPRGRQFIWSLVWKQEEFRFMPSVMGESLETQMENQMSREATSEFHLKEYCSSRVENRLCAARREARVPVRWYCSCSSKKW